MNRSLHRLLLQFGLRSAVAGTMLGIAALRAPAHEGDGIIAGIDTDENGLSDVYEMLYPALKGAAADGDADGDGQTNQQENTAGTNPLDASDRIALRSAVAAESGIVASWQSVTGKRYQLQVSDSTTGPWRDEGPTVEGTGGSATAQAPWTGHRQFVRVAVTDMDSDGDGATDWEELRSGTDPFVYDTTGSGLADRIRIVEQLTLPNTISAFATGLAGSEDGRPVEFTLVRHGGINPFSVQYSLGGSATPGVDYTVPSGRAVFPAGATTALVRISPVIDTVADDGETIVLTLAAGAGYSTGQASATAVIHEDSGGLTGYYFNSQNTSYQTFLDNIATGTPTASRVDPVIDFNFGPGPPGGTGQRNAGSFSMRWEGSLTAPSSGDYTFHLTVDRGGVLYFDDPGSPAINQWSATIDNPGAPPEFTITRTLAAGRRYNLRLDYRESSTTPDHASVQLAWTPPGGTREVVPSSALSPYPAGPVLSGEDYAVALAGGPFSYALTVTPPGAVFAAHGLPAGLTINPATGVITGSVTRASGLQFVTVSATDATGTAFRVVPIHVIETGGGVTRDVWDNPSGTGTASLPLHTTPSSTTLLTSLEVPTGGSGAFGERIRGHLIPPVTGNYTFFLTSDESAELWISATPESANRLKRAWITGATAPAGSWNSVPTQQSLPMRLTAGHPYYLEVLRRETTGPHHLAVGWHRPGQTAGAPVEVIPGWALSPYVPASGSDTGGTLYTAILTPQAGAATLGTGSAVLTVNEERTAATLRFTFSNLTGPITSQHIHDARPVPGPSGGIIYDIDEESPDSSGFRHWTFAPTGNHTVADILAAVESGQAYINLHTNTYPEGEIKGFFMPATGSRVFIPPAAPEPAELTLPANTGVARQAAARFLQQATFGPRPDSDGLADPGVTAFGGYEPDSIEAVIARGYAGWIDDQLAMPAGPDPTEYILQFLPPGTIRQTPSNSRRNPNAPETYYNGAGPMASFLRDYYERYPRSSADGDSAESSGDLWRAWWRTAVTAPDQLRHRVAFALSEILVVSEDGVLDNKVRALAHYHDLLYYHGLGNFRTLLEQVTLNPAMGRYLDMLGNRKPNASTGYIPNENYAREILQLFSIGLYRSHPDGTLVLDNAGMPVDTYGQDNVVGFAHTFTGWSYPRTGGNDNYISPMDPRPNDHYAGEKLLLENAVIPAADEVTEETCNADLAAAHDVIFHHPNTGPFICRQLIQRLVTANPSPAYLYRVSQAFDDDGTGVRGNLKAVVRAILLDPEARNQSAANLPGFGHLKEPVIRATQMMRAFRAFSHAEATSGTERDLGTAIFSPALPVDLSLPLRSATVTYTDPDETITYSYIDETIDPDGAAGPMPATVFSMVVPRDALILLRRQTAPPAGGLVIDPVTGDTNSPENGVYVLTDPQQPLTRWAGADTPGELNNAWIMAATCRRDPPDVPWGDEDELGGSLSGNRHYRIVEPITTLGTDPVIWQRSSSGHILRHQWEVGSTTSAFQQTPLRSPTVFNFFEPGHIFAGATGDAGLYSPEFQITNETTTITTINWFYNLTRRNSSDTSQPFSYGQGYSYGDPVKREVKLDLTRERAMAGDAGALVDHIASLLTPNQMPPRLRTLLVEYLNTLPASTDPQKMNRVGEALYLFAMSPEFATQR